MDTLTRRNANPAPVDAGGGGGGGNGNGAGILAKATPSQRESWDRQGLTEKQRIDEMTRYNNLKASGRVFR